MALALYRKYRPRTFAEIIGQEHVTEPLSQALRSGRLHHAYLFSGPRGCGKTSSARILARSLNCEQGPTPEPCGVCASCRSLANDGVGSIDVIEIDAASHGGVDDARDLREKAFFAPVSSRYKIYVIDEAHMVSSAGFNALLKLVEEPPDYVKFIFATTEPEKVLGTIKSRTHHYPFRLIPPAVLRPYLQQLTEAEGIHVEPAVFPLVVRAGGGSARDALSVLDQLIAGAGPEGVTYQGAVPLLGVTDVALIDEMCDALAAGDGATAYATIDRVAEAGHDPRRYASDLLERFRDLIILQQVPDAIAKGLIDGPADQLDAMTAQATRLGPATLSRCADIVHNGLVEMRGTTAPRLLLELITARMLLPGADDSAGALLQRLERMERRLTLTDGSVRPHPEPASHTGGDINPAAPTSPAPPAGCLSHAPRQPPRDAGRRRQPSRQRTRPGPTRRRGRRLGSTGRRGAPAGVDGRSRESTGAAAQSSAAEGVRPSRGRAGSAEPSPAAGSDGDEVAPAFDSPTSDAKGSGRTGTVADESVGAQTGIEGSGTAAVPKAAAPHARRPEPAGVLPDAPEEPGDAPVSGVPGQLSAAAIREVWPEIISAVGRQSKKVAALASGATVRDLDGEIVVLTFRFPAHAKMVAAEPDLLTNALFEALGGRWQIRCEVAGEAGGATAGAAGGPARRPLAQVAPAQGGPAQGGPAQGGPAHGGSAQGGPAHGGSAQGGSARSARKAAPTRQREAAAPAAPGSNAHSGDDDDWPEPAKPGESVAPAGGRAPGDSSEPSDPVAGAPGSIGSVEQEPGAEISPAVAGPGASAAAASSDGEPSSNSPFPGPAFPVSRSVGPTADVPGDGPAESRTGTAPAGGSAAARAAVSGSGEGPAAVPPAGGLAAARAAASGSGQGASTGLAAARAAAAAGTRNGNGARPADAGNASGGWAEEPPYDPEYDGPAPGAAVGYEGFDPGDEPLDEVIDEKTARQSGEQQAMQLLQEAFGAEKIGES